MSGYRGSETEEGSRRPLMVAVESEASVADWGVEDYPSLVVLRVIDRRLDGLDRRTPETEGRTKWAR